MVKENNNSYQQESVIAALTCDECVARFRFRKIEIFHNLFFQITVIKWY
jgi:hypothetical protein